MAREDEAFWGALMAERLGELVRRENGLHSNGGGRDSMRGFAGTAAVGCRRAFAGRAHGASAADGARAGGRVAG